MSSHRFAALSDQQNFSSRTARRSEPKQHAQMKTRLVSCTKVVQKARMASHDVRMRPRRPCTNNWPRIFKMMRGTKSTVHPRRIPPSSPPTTCTGYTLRVSRLSPFYSPRGGSRSSLLIVRDLKTRRWQGTVVQTLSPALRPGSRSSPW